MNKTKNKVKWICRLYDENYDQIYAFETKIICGTDVWNLCKRFRRLYFPSIKGKCKWGIIKC